jgi:hypothetical protein
MVPFDCIVRAIEARSCSLRLFVPLAGQLLMALSDVAKPLLTATETAVLGDMHVHFLARLALNSLPESTAACSLSPFGRAEIRNRETGCSIQDLRADISLFLTVDVT